MAGVVTPLTPWLHTPRSSTDISSLKGLPSASRHEELFIKVAAAKDRLLPPKLSCLLPSAGFLLQHPLHVVSTRSILGAYTARLPQGRDLNDVYLRTGPKIKRQFVSSVSAGLVDGDGKDIKTVKDLEFVDRDLWTTTKEIYKRDGVRGFYRGALSAHAVDLVQFGLSYNIETIARAASELCVGEATKEEEEERPISRVLCRDIPTKDKIVLWLRRSEGRDTLAKIIAANLAGALVYPLSTVALRQVAYESYDGVRVGFLDMARLTILYDGSTAFYNGFGVFALARVLGSAVQLGAVCASAVLNLPPGVGDRVSAIVDVLMSPLMQHSRHLRALSNMPGLPHESPALLSRLPSLLSPVTLLDLAVNMLFMTKGFMQEDFTSDRE